MSNWPPWKRRAVHDLLMERNVVWMPPMRYSRQRPAHPQDRLGARLAPDDQLREQRVVEEADFPAGVDAALQPHARPGRLAQAGDAPGLRQEVVVRVFGVDAALDGVPFERMSSWSSAARRPAGDRELLLDDVDAVTISVTGCSTWSRVFISRK